MIPEYLKKVRDVKLTSADLKSFEEELVTIPLVVTVSFVCKASISVVIVLF